MVKQYKKINKSKSRSSKSRSSKSKSRSSSSMKGGDGGRVALPPSYYGNGTEGYFPGGSSELNSVGKQLAVSQGTIWGNGTMAGPNLYPMKGGNSACKKQRKSKNKNKSSKSCQMKNKKKKTKINKHKKH